MRLALPAEIIERSLERRLVTAADGELRRSTGFLSFAARSAHVPLDQPRAVVLRADGALGRRRPCSAEALDDGAICLSARPLSRALQPLGVPLPIASSKVEGMLAIDDAGRLDDGAA